MVYAMAARKTGSFMVIALVISLAIMMLLSGDLEAPTGRVTSSGIADQGSATWIIFLLGLFVGAIIVGTYVYVAHLEAKRKE